MGTLHDADTVEVDLFLVSRIRLGSGPKSLRSTKGLSRP